MLFYHASFFFLIIDLYLFIGTVITQIPNPIVELAISVESLTKEAKTEIQTHPVIAEIAISKCSI